jgi:hypothetical protein
LEWLAGTRRSGGMVTRAAEPEAGGMNPDPAARAGNNQLRRYELPRLGCCYSSLPLRHTAVPVPPAYVPDLSAVCDELFRICKSVLAMSISVWIR